MSISSAAPRRHLLAHASPTALLALGALTIMLATPAAAPAQDAPPQAGRWSLRIPSGGFVPTGAQRRSIDDAQVTGAQLSWLARPGIALTGTFAWARSRDVAATDAPKLDVFTSDVGIEVRSAERFTEGPVALRAFAGLGAGARSYNYRSMDVDATHNLAAYGSVGGELGMGRVGVRLEARDYATGFRPLVGAGKSQSRNDVVVMAAIRFNRNRQ